MKFLCWRALYSHTDPTQSTWPVHRIGDVINVGVGFPMNIAERGFWISLPLEIYPMVGDVPATMTEISIWPKK